MTVEPPSWLDSPAGDIHRIIETFGPNTQEISRVFLALRDMRWLAHMGEPLIDNSVSVIENWNEALAVFDNSLLYTENGMLMAACDHADRILTQLPGRGDWWHRSRAEAKRYEALSTIPESLSPSERELIVEHLYELVSMVLVEIIASPEVGCTYFREQFEWFRAGRFPCGWDGQWPGGRMRVF